MPFIKKSFITDRLLANVPIEKYIGQFVNLKKSGSNYMCCCPFHHEKTPSCSITPSKQMFYCFGCKEHGNVIDFAMKYKNLSFVEAVEEVAAFAGIEVEYEKGAHQSKEAADKQKIYFDFMDRAASLFTSALNSAQGAEGLAYFKNQRGLSDKTIVEARLGYAPKNPRFLQESLCRSKEDEQILIDLGLLVKGEYGVHGMYRNRVMIPIFDKRGRVISFGGRTMGDDKPKYMNTKETPIYKKRNELFGLYETLKANNNRPARIVVVEGYMDVISVRQSGCNYAVASLGTATTVEQITEMFRYTDKVICCYDGDSAGRNAAWHALVTITPILQDDKEIRFSFLPVEHDPDSLVKEQGLSAFVSYLDNAITYPEFLIAHLSTEYNLSDPNGLALFVSETIKYISKIPVLALRSVALKLLSATSGIAENQLYDMLKKTLDGETSDANIFKDDIKTHDDQGNILNTPMRRLIAFICQQPTIVSTVFYEFKIESFVNLCSSLQIPGTNVLGYLIKLIGSKRDLTPSELIEYTRESEYDSIVRKLISAPLIITHQDGSDIPFNDRVDYFVQLLIEVISKPLKDKADELKIKMNQGDNEALAKYSLIQNKMQFRP